MTISMPYVMVNNIENERKLMVDYSKNPCINELADFLKCITYRQNITTNTCKNKYIIYMSCMKSYNLASP